MNDNMQLSTGEDAAGTIFNPFDNVTPSEQFAAEKGIQQPSTRRISITQNESGWTEAPDAGKTTLAKADYETPVGAPWILLLFAFIYCSWKSFLHRKRRAALVFLLFCLGSAQANITALRFNASAFTGGTDVRIDPTIPSVPEGAVYVCWALYYDADCTHEVPDIAFNVDAGFGSNAVHFTVPSVAGTYYIKTSLHTEGACIGLLDSYYVNPLVVYPIDADIVLARDEQSNGTSIQLNESESMKAYAVLRFSKATLNDPELTEYERYNYFISFPFDVQLADIYGIGTIGQDWRICYYDGIGRAQEGFFAERTTNWVAFNDTDSILHAGQGYLLQLNSLKMSEDNDVLWDKRDIATLFFPALSPISDIRTRDVTIPALTDAYRCTIDLSDGLGPEADRRNKDSYWRCIGIPGFESPSGIDGVPFLYEWNKSDNTLSVVSSKGFNFFPGQAYLIQNGEEFTWLSLAAPVSAIVAKERNTTFLSFSQFRIDLSFNLLPQDRTYIRLADDDLTTDHFDFGWDLSKELNTGLSNIYSIADNEYLAANCLPDDVRTRTIPLGIIAHEDGTYRLTLPEAPQDRSLILVDKETGTHTLLTKEDTCAIALKKGTYNNRFYIEIPPVSLLPTEIQTSDDAPQTSKILFNGLLYLRRQNHLFTPFGTRIQ